MRDDLPQHSNELPALSQDEFVAKFLRDRFGTKNGKRRKCPRIRASRMKLAVREYKRQFGIVHQNEETGADSVLEYPRNVNSFLSAESGVAKSSEMTSTTTTEENGQRSLGKFIQQTPNTEADNSVLMPNVNPEPRDVGSDNATLAGSVKPTNEIVQIETDFQPIVEKKNNELEEASLLINPETANSSSMTGPKAVTGTESAEAIVVNATAGDGDENLKFNGQVHQEDSDKNSTLKNPGSNTTVQANSIVVTGTSSSGINIASPNVNFSPKTQTPAVTPIEFSDENYELSPDSRGTEMNSKTSPFKKETDKWIEDLEKLKQEYAEPLTWNFTSETVSQAMELHKQHVSKLEALRTKTEHAMAETQVPRSIRQKIGKEAMLLDYWLRDKFVNLERFQEFLRSIEHEIKWTKERKQTEIQRDWSEVRAGDIAGLDLFYATIGSDWKHHRATVEHLLHTHPIQQLTSHPGYAMVKSLSKTLKHAWSSCLMFIRCGKAQWEDAKMRRLTCRASPLTRPLNVTVIGEITTAGVTYKQFQQVSLIEKISTSIWKIRDEDGKEARLPSVVIQIPPNPKRSATTTKAAPPPKRRRP